MMFGKEVKFTSPPPNGLRHEYEPDEGGSHPMHSDPYCAVCGRPKRDPLHT